VTPRDLAQRRRVLFTMLTALGFRYPPGREPPVMAGLRLWLGGRRGVGRITAGMAQQEYDLLLTPPRPRGVAGHVLPGRHRALADADGGVGLGAGAVAGGAAGSLGGAQKAGGGVLVS
jgi:hypothetical protein